MKGKEEQKRCKDEAKWKAHSSCRCCNPGPKRLTPASDKDAFG